MLTKNLKILFLLEASFRFSREPNRYQHKGKGSRVEGPDETELFNMGDEVTEEEDVRVFRGRLCLDRKQF